MLLPLRWMLFQTEADVTVPDVVGQSQASAETELEGVGFVVAVDSTNSETVPLGDVISQDPAALTLAQFGSTVTIVVSLGPAPEFGSSGGRLRDARRRGFLTLIGGRG